MVRLRRIDSPAPGGYLADAATCYSASAVYFPYRARPFIFDRW